MSRPLTTLLLGLVLTLPAAANTPTRTRPRATPTPIAPALAETLLFCNQPERLTIPGIYGETRLASGKTYRIFFHYRSDGASQGPLTLALVRSDHAPFSVAVRKGIAPVSNDPPRAGQEALARYLGARTEALRARQGTARWTLDLKPWQVASGVLTVRADKEVRLRISFANGTRPVAGAHIAAVPSPRRETHVALQNTGDRAWVRIGDRAPEWDRQIDGAYGLVYAVRVDAPLGRRVQVTFSPRGGQAGVVASLGGKLWQSGIVAARQSAVLAESVVGKDGLSLVTIPFGGVFYPVELCFRLLE
jgi:hypothetical protein